MNHKSSMILLALILTASDVPARSAEAGERRVMFKADNGAVVTLDQHNSILRTPSSKIEKLSDCSDKFQTCLKGHDGFVFSYFRSCNDVNYKHLKFKPRVLSAIQNDLWMVFDASPNYMFHYSIPNGIIGIYIGPTASFDFRRLFQNRNLRLNKFDSMEYRLEGPGNFAACTVAAM